MKAYNQLTQQDKLLIYHFLQTKNVTIQNEIERKYRNYYMYAMLESVLEEYSHQKIAEFIDSIEERIKQEFTIPFSLN